MMKLVSLVIALSVLAAAAHAGTWDQQQSFAAWKRQDDCSRQAQRQFPDYTTESNAKREHALRQCLATGNLPRRAVLSPPSQQPSGGGE